MKRPRQTRFAFPPRIRDLVRMSREAEVLMAAVELGLFDAIGPSGAGALEISRRKHLNYRAVEIVLDALTAIEFLAKRGRLYFNRPIARRFLLEKSPGSVVANLRHSWHVSQAWMHLDEILKTGRPPALESERDSIAAAAALFAQAMVISASDAAKALPDTVDLGKCRTLIDVGGGAGHFSYQLCRRHPRLTATIFDRPLTVRFARRRMKEYGPGARMRAVAGDFTKGELPGRHDAALVSQIIHSLGEKKNRELMGKIFRCLNPGGVLILRDFLLHRGRVSPPNAALFAVNMLANTKSGRTYTFDEVKEWMRAAGFINIKRKGPPAFGNASVMLARKPV